MRYGTPPSFIDLDTNGMATGINSVGIAVGYGEEGCFLWQGAERLSLQGVTLHEEKRGLNSLIFNGKKT
ncbi:MAG: hypothetical protein ACI9NC_005361 [Verrucomicrobiales bacterium]|jgi:hypothetical protein